jgi:hypothetical protein
MNRAMMAWNLVNFLAEIENPGVTDSGIAIEGRELTKEEQKLRGQCYEWCGRFLAGEFFEEKDNGDDDNNPDKVGASGGDPPPPSIIQNMFFTQPQLGDSNESSEQGGPDNRQA